MKIEFNDLYSQWLCIKDDAMIDINNLFINSDFILGQKVKNFEDEFSKYCNVKYSVGVSSGTDGLKLALKSLAKPEEKIGIFLPANTFVATYIAARDAFLDSDIFLIDCDKHFQIDTFALKNYVKNFRNNYKTCFIIPVHLYGYTANMKEILSIASEFNCLVVEDASQAHGAISNTGKRVGGDGSIASFSLYPSKNLGAAGDAGVVTTNDEFLYNKIISLRNYGTTNKYHHNNFGYNCRLDTLQAIILFHKLKLLDEWNEKRKHFAERLLLSVTNENIILPKKPDYCLKSVNHIFPVLVENRDNFLNYLIDNNIEYGIHYPTPITKMSFAIFNNESSAPLAESLSSKLVSLPIHPFLTAEKIEYLIDKLNNYSNIKS